ncbi:MAG: hypothetical protein FJ293_06850 [Planctomycetes bacterium]|nr:hypothetical protein [Planctomycetota bacterium]
MPPPADALPPSSAPDSSGRKGLCLEVAAATPELLAPDRGEPHLVRLRAHLRACRTCATDLAAQASVIEQLRQLPVASDSRKSWVALRAALASERRDPVRAAARSPQASGEEFALIALIGLALAAALVRLNPLAERALRSAETLSAPWLLPAAFVAFGALVSLLALPLLRRARPAPLPLRFRPRCR